MRVIWEAAAARGDDEYLVYGNERYSYADAAALRALPGRLSAE